MQTYESFKQVFHKFRKNIVKTFGKRPECYTMYTWFPSFGIVTITGRNVDELWAEYQKYQRSEGIIK